MTAQDEGLPGLAGSVSMPFASAVGGSVAVGGRAAAVVVWRGLAAGLAGTPRVRVGRWVSERRGRRLVYDRTRQLTDELPTVPAALRVYNDAGEARSLALDFDPKLVSGDAGRVEDDVAVVVELLRQAGARVVVDASPTGGRHVWVPLAAPAGRDDLLPLAAALQRLCPSLDVSPLRSVATGCLTAPGSPTRCGGHRTLVTPLAAAVDAIERRSAPDLLDRLRERLAPELAAPAAAGEGGAVAWTGGAGRRVDERAVACPGGPRPLDAIGRGIAERGIWPATRRTAAGQPWTGSEARQSLLASCAARGWSLADVRARLAGGAWPGLARLYARYGRNAAAQLARDWSVALRYAAARPAPTAAAGTGVSQGHTSGSTPTHGGAATDLTARDHARAEYRHLRRMYLIMERAADAEEWGQGETGRTRRAVLRSLIVMGMRRGSRYLQVGTRNLTFSAGLLDHSTVARVLRELRADPDGWVDLVEAGRGDRGDLYELRIPQKYADLVSDREALPSGPLAAVHPVYGELGLSAWRIVEAIEAGARTFDEVSAASGVSDKHVRKVVKVLDAVRLIVPAATGGWRRTRRTLSAVARSLGVLDRVAERRARYRAERDAWRAVLAERGRADWAELTWMTSVDGPIWWPDLEQLQPPPSNPDPPTASEALALLVAELGATVIPA